MQLHKRGDEYFYGSRPVQKGIFLVLPISDPRSRKGKDYTYLYGKHAGTGSLTPHIDKAFDSRVDECVLSLSLVFLVPSMSMSTSIILDGEMLVWDPVTERNIPFGTLKTAALGHLRFYSLLRVET